MRPFMMAAAAVTMGFAMVGTAAAASLNGGPATPVGGGLPAPGAAATKCFVGAPGFGPARDSRFGTWQDCPKPAGQATVVSTPQRTARPSASR